MNNRTELFAGRDRDRSLQITEGPWWFIDLIPSIARCTRFNSSTDGNVITKTSNRYLLTFLQNTEITEDANRQEINISVERMTDDGIK